MKLEKYNQKLLAILGTMAIVFLGVAFFVFLSISILEFERFNDDDGIESGILSDERIEELQKENKRQQVISYTHPRLVDTLNSIYIIPVSYKTLDEEEGINGILNMSDAPSAKFEKYDSRYANHIYGEYSNIVIYNNTENTSQKLFDTRVNFNNIKIEYLENDILLLMSVSTKDTYKDGVINLNDLKKLFIYSFSENDLKEIGMENMDVFDFKFLNNEKNLTILFGNDKNTDGKFDEYVEPTVLKKYDYNKEKLSHIVNDKINSELQKTLEGTKD